MLLEKYAPKSTKEIIGNSAAVADIKRFLTGWKKGRALLVHGPPGSGKSVAVRLIAGEGGYGLVEPEDGALKGRAEAQQGIFSKKRIVLLEGLEAVPTRRLTQLIKESSHPVICTMNDAYELAPATRKMFRLVRFEKVSKQELIKFLEDICGKEQIACDLKEIEQLARTSNGDVRALLIDLAGCSGYRDTTDSIFKTLQIIFRTMSIENAKIAIENSEKDPEELVRWLEQNIPEEYRDMRAIAAAYDYLSKADVFRSRIIRRQSWSLQKYFSSLAVYGTSLAKGRPSVRFASYRPPVFMKRPENSALEKIARSMHVSKRHAAEYIPIIKMLARGKSDILEKMSLDENEMAFVTGK